MHVRFSTVVGMSVVDEDGTEELGRIAHILIHPDTGKVEGFFVKVPGLLLRTEMLFLATEDIQRWGLRVVVRGPDVLSPVAERIRLQTLLEDGRPVLLQRIQTDTGKYMGRCGDVQFETEHFMVEWLWPRKLWRWGMPLPLVLIVEVRKDAIVVRDPAAPAPEKTEREKAPMLKMPEVA